MRMLGSTRIPRARPSGARPACVCAAARALAHRPRKQLSRNGVYSFLASERPDRWFAQPLFFSGAVDFDAASCNPSFRRHWVCGECAQQRSTPA